MASDGFGLAGVVLEKDEPVVSGVRGDVEHAAPLRRRPSHKDFEKKQNVKRLKT